MEKFRLRWLMLVPFLALGGCATPNADLDATAPLQPGDGSFSIALAMDTSLAPAEWKTLYVAKQGDAEPSEADMYPLTLRDLPGTGLQVAYGQLPAGSYRLDHIFYSFATGNLIHEIRAPLPAGLSIDIEPGKHLDLGVLIYVIDPDASNRLAFGWVPAPAGVAAAEQAYISARVPAANSPVSWKSPDTLATAKVLSLYALDNPTVNTLVADDGGTLLAPAHLGRILLRDGSQTWHILDTGYLGDIETAVMLKDGRIVALVSRGPMLVSDAAHGSWRVLTPPAPGADIHDLALLADGRIEVVTKESYMRTTTNDVLIQKEHYGVYIGSPDKDGWKFLSYADPDDTYTKDGGGFYFYEAGKDDVIMDLGVSTKLTVPDAAGRPARKLPLPAVAKLIRPLAGHALLLLPDHDILDRYDYVSEDGGVTWHALPRDLINGSFHMNGELIWKGPGDYLADAGTRPPLKQDIKASPWKNGLYETRDYGQTWTYVTEQVSQPCHIADVHDFYVDGKIWTFCEGGEVWSYDIATRSLHRERDTLISASSSHG